MESLQDFKTKTAAIITKEMPVTLTGRPEQSTSGLTLRMFTGDLTPSTFIPEEFLDESIVGGGVLVVGLPGPAPVFYILHVTAMLALVPSMLCSGVVMVSILWTARRRFWAQPVPQRLVVYLSACDLLFSLTHLSDHVYIFIHHAFPPPALCQLFAFCMNEFILAQILVVTYTAVGAFSLIVREQALPLGRADWRLLVPAVGLPAVPLSIAAAYGYLGPTGIWCAIDVTKPLGPLLQNARTVTIIVMFCANAACYILIWLKIKQVSGAMSGLDAGHAATRGRYQRSARVMSLFVGVYVAQWWAPVIYSLWAFYGPPHEVVIAAAVVFTNLGGLFNVLVYTVIRRMGNDKNKPTPGKPKPDLTARK